MTIFNFGFTNPFANGAPSNEIESFPDEDRGLGIAFDETEGKPEMKGLNGLFNKISQSLLSIKQNGLIGWTSDIEYIQGGFTIESGKLYQAIRNNTGKQPSLSQNDWTLWINPSNITVDSNGNITKTANTDGSFSLKVNDATTTVKGVARFATATEVTNKSNVSAFVSPSNAQTIAVSNDVGVGQTWQDMKASRINGGVYQNTTGKPIQVFLMISDTNGVALKISIGDISYSASYDVVPSSAAPFSFIIPNNTTYSFSWGTRPADLQFWWELR